MSQQIDIILKIVPSVYFVLVVLIHTLIGYKRRFKRSLSFLIRSLIVFSIYLGIYLLAINLEIVDIYLLKFVNLFMGSNGLQNMLGVSSSCTSIKDCLVEFIPRIMGDNVYASALYDNGAYIRALVSMVYNFVWFIIVYILYGITIFIVKRIYCHKHHYREEKEKLIEEYENGERKSQGRLGGSLIGAFRGIVSGIIVLSLFGNVLYISTGGKGQNKNDETITLDETYDPYIKMYQSVSHYGEYGIYYILNAISDKQNVPYYLYITDVVFHGKINDEENSYNETISLRNELASITSFATRGTKLLFKYGGQEFKDIVLKRDTSKTILDELVSLYSLEAFQNEFNALLDELDLNSYLFNFAFGFARSILISVDDPTSPLYSLPDDTKEILKICFKKGYKSSVIPYETDSTETLPYISPKVIVSSSDIKYLFEMFTKFYEYNKTTYETNFSKTIASVSLVKELIPIFKKLSIMETSSKETFNPMISRLYAFAEVKYLAAPNEESKVKSINKLKTIQASSIYKDIDWIGELSSLLDVVSDGLTSYTDALNTLNENGEDTSSIPLVIFEATKSTTYSSIVNNICSSIVLQNLMETSIVTYYIEETLAKVVNTTRDDLALPDNISFVDTDSSRGEAYKILTLLHTISTSEDVVPSDDGEIKVYDFIKKIIKNEIKDNSDFINILKIKNAKDSSKRSEVITSLLDSDLFRSTISNYIFNNEDTIEDSIGFELVIPPSATEYNKKEQRCNIKISEFENIIDVLTKVDVEAFKSNDIGSILNEFKKVKTEFSSSLILRGSISNYLMNNEFNDFKFIIPTSSLDENNILSSTELGYFFDFIDYVDTDKLDGEMTYLLEVLVDHKQLLFDSKVLKASISNYIYPLDGSKKEVVYNDFTLIVPSTSIDENNYVKDNELESIIEFIAKIKDTDTTSISNDQILTIIYHNEQDGEIKILDSYILNASIVNVLIDEEQVSSSIPTSLDSSHDGSEEALHSFTSENGWYNEIKSLINALSEICYDEESEEIKISNLGDASYLKNSISNLLEEPISTSSCETKLDVIYESLIVKNKVTTTLDDSLGSVSEVKDSYKDECKEDGLYKKEEIASLLNFLKEYNISIEDFESFEFASLLDKDDNNYVLKASTTKEDAVKLDVIYSSTLLKLLVSDKLDESIKDNINDYENVKLQIKVKLNVTSSNYIFAISELKATLKVMGDLNINFSKDSSGEYTYSFNGASILKQLYNDETKLNSIYSSKIVIGVVTKYLSDYLRDESIFSSNIIDHPYAYSDFIKYQTKSFYKQEEIDNLFKLLKDERLPNITFDESADTYEIDFTKDKINLSAITDLFYNETTTFYLLDGYISNTLMNLGSLIIPSTSASTIENDLDDKLFITHVEIKTFLTMINSLGVTKLSDFDSISDSLKIKEEHFDLIMESSILKESIITKEYDLYPSEEKAEIKEGYIDGNLILSNYVSIDENEMKNALSTLLYLSKELSSDPTHDYISFSIIDDLTINDIIKIYKEDKDTFVSTIKSSSLVYNLTSDIIIEHMNNNVILKPQINANTEEKTVWDLTNVKTISRDIIKESSFDTILQLISSYII